MLIGKHGFDAVWVSGLAVATVVHAMPDAAVQKLGAEVVKIERPGTGDELRRWRLQAGDTSMRTASATASRACFMTAKPTTR